jgi:hypothetical protein
MYSKNRQYFLKFWLLVGYMPHLVMNIIEAVVDPYNCSESLYCLWGYSKIHLVKLKKKKLSDTQSEKTYQVRKNVL